MALINYEIVFDLSWTKECRSKTLRTFRRVDPNADPVVYELTSQTISEIFQIDNAKSYVPVVTLSIKGNNNIKFLENIKQGFKITLSWNKYRSEITTLSKNKILDYLIDLTIRNINRLFALSFKNDYNDPTRDSFEKYCMPLVEITYFNALIDNKPFFFITQ